MGQAMTTGRLRIGIRRFGPFEAALQKQFDDFCNLHAVSASLDIVPFDLDPLQDALLTSGGLREGRFDIGLIVTDWLPKAVEDGHLLNLSSFPAQVGPDRDAPGWPDCLQHLQQVGGQLWGVPYHDGPQCLIYRSDLFATGAEVFAETYGRALAPPQSWDDFVDIARFFTDPESGIWGTVVASYPDAHNTVYDFCAQVWSRGGKIVDASGTPTLFSAAAVEGLAFYRWLVRESGVVYPGATGMDSVQSGAIFAEGKAAMMANWFGFAAHSETSLQSSVKGAVNVAPMPGAAGHPSAAVLVYWLLVIGSGCRNPGLARAFVQHATSPKMDRLLTMEGGIGCRTSTWTDPVVAAKIPFAGQMQRLHGLARTLPADRRLPELAGIIDAAVASALNTEVATDVILMSAQNKALDLWNRKE